MSTRELKKRINTKRRILNVLKYIATWVAIIVVAYVIIIPVQCFVDKKLKKCEAPVYITIEQPNIDVTDVNKYRVKEK